MSNNIPIKNRGAQTILKHTPQTRFPQLDDNLEYIAVSKKDGREFQDYLNKSGVLTAYIEKHYPQVVIPHKNIRLREFKITGRYWWEEYFDVIIREKNIQDVKKCPYCEWTTIDIENKSGALEQHLLKKHGITKEQYIIEHPEDKEYFEIANKTLQRQWETDPDKYVICAICGKKLSRIDSAHLSKHGITKDEYILKYGQPTISKSLKKRLQEIMLNSNMNLEMSKFTTKPETELLEFITSHNIIAHKDRKTLKGKEIDIFIPSLNIGIEFNGNIWHSEFRGQKDPYSHLNKTLLCEEKGINLIHIFEDEYMYHKNVVLDNIARILNISLDLPVIQPSDCIFKNIDASIAIPFLSNFSLKETPHHCEFIGAFYNEELITVGAFLKEDKQWVISNLTHDYNLYCDDVKNEIINHFLSNYNPNKLIINIDKRWVNPNEIINYQNIGFVYHKDIAPDYTLFNSKLDRYKRFLKEYIQDRLKITDQELNDTDFLIENHYDRIWDCGYSQYIWENKKEEDI